MAKANEGAHTQEDLQALVLPIQRSFIGRIIEVSQASQGGAFKADTVIVTVKNIEEKGLPITIFIANEFLQKDESSAKLKILFKGNIVDITVEDHEALKTGYYDSKKDSEGKKIKDLFLTPHTQNTKNFFVNAFETDTVDYRGILRKSLDKDEVSEEIEMLEKKRSLNELAIAETITRNGNSAFGGLR